MTDQGIVFASSHKRPFRKDTRFYKIDLETRELDEQPWGHGSYASVGPKGGVVINRLGMNTLDTELAFWKRYKGGTAGDLWIDAKGDGEFKRLIQLNGNVGRPMWIESRIYFISDHEGHSNLYSCNLEGAELKKESNQAEFYVRNPQYCGKSKTIVYHAGGDLFRHDLSSGECYKIDVHYPSPKTHTRRKIVSSSKNLEHFTIDKQSKLAAFSTRGQVFCLPLWHGATLKVPDSEGLRYRYPFFLNDKNKFGYIVDSKGEEHLRIQSYEGGESREIKGDFGRVVELEVVPQHNTLIFTNHRNQICKIDLEKDKIQVLDTDPFQRIGSFDISPDGQWLAYSKHTTTDSSSLFILQIETGETQRVTAIMGQDIDPHFGPDGSYLYFISYREFVPVYDSLHFELGFPRGGRPYVLTLNKEVHSPFSEEYLIQRSLEKDAEEKDSEEKEDTESDKKEASKVKTNDEKKVDASDDSSEEDEDEKVEPIKIDFDGILDRQIAFPVDDGKYFGICATKDRVFFGLSPVKGILSWDDDDSKYDNWLESYDLKNQKEESWAEEIEGFELLSDRKNLVIYKDKQVRVLKPSEKPEDKTEPGPQSGIFDFSRVHLEVDPPSEWRQMLREAWRLQRDHFWDPDKFEVDWDSVYRKYEPICGRLSSRRELNDLLWEMQGELGASHAYASGGEVRYGPYFSQAYLGASIKWNGQAKKFQIQNIYRGQSWVKEDSSPLMQPGVIANEGDFIVEINSRPLSLEHSISHALSTLGRKSFRIGIQTEEGEIRRYTIRGLDSEKGVLYRQWVNANREFVHKQSGGKIGYIHIPDMGVRGYSEFHKYFLTELYKEGLIVDVRFNGGGHVSGLLLEKLARERIAYCKTRWSGVHPYPDASPDGPMVALTNEFAGSDGDIFSHSFKLMKLGPLLGKRTWGGVIGIWPPYDLMDGGQTTQPEFAFWFKDVGWKVENYGTDPDIEVENLPSHESKGIDNQLQAALDKVLELHKENPPQQPSF